MRERVLLFTVLLSVAACQVYGNEYIGCREDVDCPSGWSCGSNGFCTAGRVDGGVADAGEQPDSGIDAGVTDAGADAGGTDGGAMDSGTADAGNACSEGQTLCGQACVDLMSDNANCGVCGNACSNPCNSGECTETFYTGGGTSNVTGLAADSSSIYWNEGDAVKKLAFEGGSPTTLASGLGPTKGIVVDSTHAYWVSGTSAPYTIYKSLLTGGGTFSVVTGITHAPFNLALNWTNIFWGNFSGHDVATAPLGGGPENDLVAGQSLVLYVAADTNNVYWASGAAQVMKLPLTGGGEPVPIASSTSPDGIAVDANNVYWTDQADGTVSFVPIAGGPSNVLASGQDHPQSIAVDAVNAYWTTSFTNSLMKVSLAGGTPVALTTAAYAAPPFVVTATSVYWASGSSIMRVTPK